MEKAFVIVDDEHKKLKEICSKSRIGYYVYKDKVKYRFFIEDTFLHVSCPDTKGNKQTMRAYSMSEIKERESKEGTQNNIFKNDIVKKMKLKNPEMTDEEIDLYSDILNEANGSIKRLILKGIDPKVAEALVKQSLLDDDFIKKFETKDKSTIDGMVL